jgi:hypothetical protein
MLDSIHGAAVRLYRLFVRGFSGVERHVGDEDGRVD